MSDAVRELAELVGWTGCSPVETDWDAVEESLGTALPADYKRLLAVIPPGVFHVPGGENVVVHPPCRVDGRLDYLHQFTAELNELAGWRRTHPQDVPLPVHPEPGGMLPWARCDRAGLFWVRSSPDPDRWTVAASNGGIWRFDDDAPVIEHFAVGAVEFINGYVSRAIRSHVLEPELDEDDGPGWYRPLEAGEWAAMATVTTEPTVRRVSLRK